MAFQVGLSLFLWKCLYIAASVRPQKRNCLSRLRHAFLTDTFEGTDVRIVFWFADDLPMRDQIGIFVLLPFFLPSVPFCMSLMTTSRVPFHSVRLVRG